MIRRHSHSVVYVLDQDRAKAFYAEKLGFEVRDDATMGDFRWITVAPKTQPDAQIVLMPIRTTQILNEENMKMLRKLVREGALGAESSTPRIARRRTRS